MRFTGGSFPKDNLVLFLCYMAQWLLAIIPSIPHESTKGTSSICGSWLHHILAEFSAKPIYKIPAKSFRKKSGLKTQMSRIPAKIFSSWLQRAFIRMTPGIGSSPKTTSSTQSKQTKNHRTENKMSPLVKNQEQNDSPIVRPAHFDSQENRIMLYSSKTPDGTVLCTTPSI